MLVSAIHQHEPAIGVHRSPPKWTSLPPHSTPLHCHRAPDLCSLLHTANSHWLSILHMVGIYFNATPPVCPHCVHKSLLCLCLYCCFADKFISSNEVNEPRPKCYMASHFSILAWKIPWTEELGGLRSTGLQTVGHDWRDLAGMHKVQNNLDFV